MRIIAGSFKGKKILSPKKSLVNSPGKHLGNDAIRPTSDRVREAIFSILSSRLSHGFEDVRVLDLFAGTGALGLEALSRGAGMAAFVDNGVQARGIIRANIEQFGIGGRARLLKRDASDLGVAERFEPFDLVFLDPPYGKGLGQKALLSARQGNWIAPDAVIVLEEAKKSSIDVPAGFELTDRRDYGDSSIWFLSPVKT